MRYLIIIFSALFSSFLFGQNLSSHVIISEVTPSLVGVDHTSEGFMVTLSSGRIIHFFRLDLGFNGHHIGNTGKIVKRYTDDGGLSWSDTQVVYEDSFDDRNINGGLVGNDRIVLTFRRYDAVALQHIDFNLIFSDDGGETWSPKQIINTVGVCSDTHTLINVPGKGYLNVFSNNNYIEIKFSNDGVDWSNTGYIWDYRASQQYKINESSFAYTKDGKIIGLMRNETYDVGGNYYQVASGDTGTTWTNPISTNMANGYFCPSPCIFYDEKHDDLWAIATDRRGGNGLSSDNINSQIWIYSNKVDDIFSNPTNWSLKKKMNRPQPSTYRLYGYATYTKKSDGNYLVVFSEASRKANSKEDADFYQFEIKYIETIAPITNNLTACYNDSDIELTALGYDIKWYTDSALTNLVYYGAVFKPEISTYGVYKYYVTQTDSVYGFESTPAIVTLTINPLPIIAINYDNVTISNNESVQLEAFNAINYKWEPSIGLDTTIGQIVNAKPTESQIYTVIGTDINGCTNVAYVTVNVDSLVSINENFGQFALSLYPNPTIGKFTIEISYTNVKQISIIDIAGNIIISKNEITTFEGHCKETFDLSNYSDGLYFIQITTDKGTYLRKLLLSHNF